MASDLRVLFLSIYDPCDEASGIGTHLRYLSKELSNIGCKVHILTCGRETMNEDMDGVRIYNLKTPFSGSVGRGIAFSFFSIRTINEFCKKNRISVVHSQSPSGFGYALLRKKRLPFVVTLHGTSFGELIHRLEALRSGSFLDFIRNAVLAQSLFALLTNIEYKRADRVVAVSKSMAREAISFYRLPEEKVVFIPNGVDTPSSFDSSNKTQSNNHTILYVGRLVWTKGVKYLLEAMPHVLADYPDAKLLLVGDGEYKTFLKRHAENLRIENSTQFLGTMPRNKLYHLYSEAGVYVQPSVYEGFGIPIIEAMSFGVPVVATCAGGIPDIISNGENGLLVKPSNPLQLAEAIIKILTDSSYRKKLVSNAKNKVQREFTWKAIAQRTLELYEGMLNGKAEGSLQNGKAKCH